MELVEKYNRDSIRQSLEKWNKEITPTEERIKRMAREAGWLWPCKDANGKYGFKNTDGEVKIPCQWKEAWPFREGIAVVISANNKYGLIDKMGNTITPCKWEVAPTGFKEGVRPVKDENGLYGYIDKNGREIIPCQWKDAWSFSEGLAAVKDNNDKYGFIDHYGKVMITPQFHGIHRTFRNRMAIVIEEDGLLGYINYDGIIVVPCKYLNAHDFSKDGLAVVQSNYYLGCFRNPDSFGYIDKKGKPVIPCQYKSARDFYDGQALVLDWEKSLWHIIDTQGKVLETKQRGFIPKLPNNNDNYNPYDYAE